MIMDERLEFADAGSVEAIPGTYLLGDVIATNSVDIGLGEPVFLVISVDTEIITGDAAGTIKFQLVSDAQAAIATDGTATVHLDTGTFVTDDAAANDARLNAGGLIFSGPLPAGKYEAYLGILYTLGTTTTAAGKVNAYLTLDPPRTGRIYPEGIS